MTITPELAQEWLDRGGNNRKVTRRRIEAMTAAIQRGEWQLTGEAIKLDDELLRNRLLGSQRDQYSTLSGREALVAIAIKAWNAWREGKTLPSLTWRAEGRRAEPFPEAS